MVMTPKYYRSHPSLYWANGAPVLFALKRSPADRMSALPGSASRYKLSTDHFSESNLNYDGPVIHPSNSSASQYFRFSKQCLFASWAEYVIYAAIVDCCVTRIAAQIAKVSQNITI
jgi:hypothetical protein